MRLGWSSVAYRQLSDAAGDEQEVRQHNLAVSLHREPKITRFYVPQKVW